MGLNFNGVLRGGLGESTVERAIDRGFGLWKGGEKNCGDFERTVYGSSPGSTGSNNLIRVDMGSMLIEIFFRRNFLKIYCSKK